MKIANVLRRFAFDEWGGTETAVWNASKIIAKNNDVRLLATKALCGVSQETVENIDIKRFDYFYPNLFLSAANKLALDKKGGNPFSLGIYKELVNGGYDLIHTHAMGRLAKEVCKAAKKRNIAYIVSFHGGNYDVPKSEFEEMAKPLAGSLGYGRIIEKLLGLNFDIVERADGIICVGQNEYEEIKKRFPNKCSAYIPNGVDFEKFGAKTDADFRNAYKIAKDKKLILCVSRIDYQKNQRALVKLVAELKKRGENIHCAIIGFVTSQSYFEELQRDILNANLGDCFTIIKGLSPDDSMLVSAYQSADFFALPSIHEPFGIVALEAWSAGLPLLAARVGGLKSLVEDGKTGFLFAPDSLDEFVKAYYAAKERGAETALTAKKLAKEKYSWECVANRIEEFYKEVKAKKNGF